MDLDHTKPDVYHRSLDLLDLLDRLIDGLPAGRAHLKDKLHRAGTSIVVNIAEGAGEFSLPDKQRFYRMAKRSATETAAILDIIGQRGQASADQLQPIQDLIIRVVSMLTKLGAK